MEKRWIALSLALLAARLAAADSPPMTRQELSYEVKAGERVRDLCARLEKQGVSSTALFLRVASSEAFPSYPFVPPPRPAIDRFEGLFTPGAYLLSLPEAAGSLSAPEKLLVTRRIVSQLLSASSRRYRGLSPRHGLNLYALATLASIVEKEAVVGRDDDKVASVFFNRMKAGMTLSSCPSVEYFLGYHRPYLTRADIAIDSPYNLYLHRGLPPTPIAFFSDGALKAVLDPADTPFEFFTFDWAAGRLYFARDYAKHLLNTEQAQRNFIRMYGAQAMFREYPGTFYAY